MAYIKATIKIQKGVNMLEKIKKLFKKDEKTLLKTVTVMGRDNREIAPFALKRTAVRPSLISAAGGRAQICACTNLSGRANTCIAVKPSVKQSAAVYDAKYFLRREKFYKAIFSADTRQ